jgi:FkbM family methyltransferase
MKIYKTLLKKSDLCFDIGANIGNKTQEISNLVSKVICVEPQPSCVSYLKNRFKFNNNIIVVGSGCGPEIGKDRLFISQFDTLSTMSTEFIETTKKERFHGVTWNSQIDIEIITLDYLIAEFGVPNFCKIDIEGYEFEVLKGLSQPIQLVSLEFTPELKENTFKCIDKLLSLDNNYLFNYSEGESGVFSFEEWQTSEEMKSFLAKNNDFKISFGDLYAKQ